MVLAALNANEQQTHDELVKKVNQKLNGDTDYLFLNDKELKNLLKQFVRCSLCDVEDIKMLYTEQTKEEFTPTVNDEYEEMDEYGRTPYIRSIIEEVKEEMRQRQSKEHSPITDPTPLPLHR